MRVAACPRPKFQIMLERIQAGACDIGVLFEIPCAIEKRMRTAPMATPSHVMCERIKSCDIRVLFEIPCGIKKRMRRSAFVSAVKNVMLERVNFPGLKRRILSHIPAGVEEGMRIASFQCSTFQVVAQRIDVGAESEVLLQIPG